MRETPTSLPSGYQLEHYTITGTLSRGGFSMVYMARDGLDDQDVVIKEFLPARYATRGENFEVVPLSARHRELLTEGRKLFFQEASTLTSLVHPNIVHVMHFFRANGTAYMVMEYKPGDNLQHYISKRGGNLSEKFILTLFPPLLDGLALVHQYRLLHLDIKPGNIHVMPGGVPLLLDFGAVHRLQTSRRYQPKQVITAGYSAAEQHDEDGYVGPWSDLYSVGATMRACIEGKSPAPSTKRREKDKLKPAAELFRRRYTPALLEAIDWAMEVDPLLRPQSVAEFQATLSQIAPTQDALEGEGMLARLVSNFPWRRAGGTR